MTTLSDKIAEVENLLALNSNHAPMPAALIAQAPTLIKEMLAVVKAASDLLSNLPISIPCDPKYPAVNRDRLITLNKAISKFAGNEGGGDNGK